MRTRSRYQDAPEELNVWPAFTDLMSNAFMILMLFLLLILFKSVYSGEKKSGLAKENERLFQELTVAKSRLIELERLSSPAKSSDAPPIIVIPDTGAFRFASGSADISPALNRYISEQLVPNIESNAKKYRIDVIEVIGHTDGQPNGGATSNLDVKLESVTNSKSSLQSLNAGSNADLGLMRALAVVRVLRSIQGTSKDLSSLQFRPYSAAQLISPTGEIGQVSRHADASRRRIEIRFTRLGKVTTAR